MKRKINKASNNPYSDKYPKRGQVLNFNGLFFVVSNVSFKTGYIGMKHVVKKNGKPV